MGKRLRLRGELKLRILEVTVRLLVKVLIAERGLRLEAVVGLRMNW